MKLPRCTAEKNRSGADADSFSNEEASCTMCDFSVSFLCLYLLQSNGCCVAASGSEDSVLPWEHNQTWSCAGQFSCSS